MNLQYIHGACAKLGMTDREINAAVEELYDGGRALRVPGGWLPVTFSPQHGLIPSRLGGAR